MVFFAAYIIKQYIRKKKGMWTKKIILEIIFDVFWDKSFRHICVIVESLKVITKKSINLVLIYKCTTFN